MNFYKKIIVIFMMTIAMISTLGIKALAITEEEYLKITEIAKEKNQYKNVENIDGISITVGETINLEEYMKADTNNKINSINILNENILSLKETSIIEGISNGIGIALINTDECTYILEVIVSNNEIVPAQRRNVVDRSYYKVFIDPGHGGSDPGAVANNIKEADLNLNIANKVKRNLENLGVNITMSRYDNSYVKLEDRGPMANQYGADVFVSIHQNSFTSSSAKGIETYYHKDKSSHKSYAQKIQQNLISNTGASDRGVKNANFAVLRTSNMVSALVECGFITNTNEANNLKNNNYQEKIAKAISDGIYTYLSENIVLKQPVFNDIKGHFAEDAILNFKEKGYIEGYPDGSFKPGQSINRAEFIKLVNRIFNYTNEAEESFDDVSSEYWYYKEVRKAIAAGYINTENKTFRPNDEITREEAAVIITNIKKNKDSNLDKIYKYSDHSLISPWAIISVEGAIEAGYMGQNISDFRPTNSLSRGEAVVLLNRII